MYILQPKIWLLMGLTIVFAVYDLRFRQVPLWLFLVSAAMGCAVCILENRDAVSVIQAMIPGILCLLLSLCTKGGMGIGDGHYFLVAALFADWKAVTVLLAVSFLLAAGVSLALILYGLYKGKNMAKKSLPLLAFLPFSMMALYLF